MMTTIPTRREALVDLTLAQSSQHGLEQVSLRAIAKAAGASTTAIFQHFESKADLIAAVADLAVERDLAFHARLENEAFGLVSGQVAFADLVTSYIEMRARRAEARVLAEMLVHIHDHPECHGALLSWQERRVAFWQALVDRQDATGALAPIIASYVLMEELYAHALADQPQYRLLLAETARAACAAAFGHSGAPGLVSQTVRTEPFSVRLPESVTKGQPIADQLLQAAVEIINEAGLRQLNQRVLASRAGVSASLIAYHFGDMRTLSIQAVWRALVQGIPASLDPEGDASAFPKSLSEWFGTLETMLSVDGGSADGFYICLARLSAQACFLACRDPQLLPLIVYLRGLEGWGTFRVSQAMQPIAGTVQRDQASAFGIWIKAQALLRKAGLADVPPHRSTVAEAAATIFSVSDTLAADLRDPARAMQEEG